MNILRWALIALLIGSGSAMAADKASNLNIKLMTEADTEIAAACGMRLWQRDRDPSSDMFAYAFAMPITTKAERNVAGKGLLKIGKTIETVDRVATGGKSYGPIFQHQLFRKSDSNVKVIVELLEFSPAGDALEIYDARVTVYDNRKYPFPMRVAGGYYCINETEADVVSSAPIPLAKISEIKSWKQVPPEVLREARSLDECDHDTLNIVWGSVYKISETRQIWEIPCALGAYQGSMVFVYQFTDEEDAFWLMGFQTPGGDTDDQPWLMEPRLDVKTGIVTSLELGRAAADCGKYQKHRLMAIKGGDSHAFELIEYREKPDCDENFIPVEEFPLIFPKQ